MEEAKFADTAPQVKDPLDGLFINTDSIKNEVASRDQIFSEGGKLIQYGAINDVDKAVNDYIKKQKELEYIK